MSNNILPEVNEWYWINQKGVEEKPFGKILEIINPKVICRSLWDFKSFYSKDYKQSILY